MTLIIFLRASTWNRPYTETLKSFKNRRRKEKRISGNKYQEIGRYWNQANHGITESLITIVRNLKLFEKTELNKKKKKRNGKKARTNA